MPVDPAHVALYESAFLSERWADVVGNLAHDVDSPGGMVINCERDVGAPAMKIACVAAALAIASPTLGGTRPSAPGTTRGFSNDVLIAAARTSQLKLIDNLQPHCDGDVTVSAWLTALTRRQAKSIVWTAGPCELVNTLNPLDAGGDYCVQAVITLEHPKSRQDTPEIEIYLDDPKHGRPGPAYAFRSMFDTVDGPDYERERRAFDDQWRERFADTPPRACQDDP